MQYNHIPAMPVEVAFYLNCKPKKVYVDCTLGGCGHAMDICRKIAPDGLLIGIDQDIDAINHARIKLKPYALNIRLFNDNFTNLKAILSHLNHFSRRHFTRPRTFTLPTRIKPSWFQL